MKTLDIANAVVRHLDKFGDLPITTGKMPLNVLVETENILTNRCYQLTKEADRLETNDQFIGLLQAEEELARISVAAEFVNQIVRSYT